MSYTVTIPLEIVNATHPGGYWELYLSYVNEGYSTMASYEMVEADLARHGLPGRYKTYQSFYRNQVRRMQRELREWSKMTKSQKVNDLKSVSNADK